MFRSRRERRYDERMATTILSKANVQRPQKMGERREKIKFTLSPFYPRVRLMNERGGMEREKELNGTYANMIDDERGERRERESRRNPMVKSAKCRLELGAC